LRLIIEELQNDIGGDTKKAAELVPSCIWNFGRISYSRALAYHKETDLLISEKLAELEAQRKDESDNAQMSVKKIRWEGSLAQLFYLFGQLKEKGFLHEENLWSTVIKHFEDKDGKPIKRDTAKAVIGQIRAINKSGKPKKGEVLEKIIEELKILDS
jgi:hypothetical protein